MKVSIIAAVAAFGSNAAYALQCRRRPEIQILDANSDMPRARRSISSTAPRRLPIKRIYAGDYARRRIATFRHPPPACRRKPDESRLDLITATSRSSRHPRQHEGAGLRKTHSVFVVSNPVDILTQLAAAKAQLPCSKLLGLGTMLDTARFRSLIAQELTRADAGEGAYPR